jgi:cysteine sulfinate desulfinase/cysteine desulfurase-like protein
MGPRQRNIAREQGASTGAQLGAQAAGVCMSSGSACISASSRSEPCPKCNNKVVPLTL